MFVHAKIKTGETLRSLIKKTYLRLHYWIKIVIDDVNETLVYVFEPWEILLNLIVSIIRTITMKYFVHDIFSDLYQKF